MSSLQSYRLIQVSFKWASPGTADSTEVKINLVPKNLFKAPGRDVCLCWALGCHSFRASSSAPHCWFKSISGMIPKLELHLHCSVNIPWDAYFYQAIQYSSFQQRSSVFNFGIKALEKKLLSLCSFEINSDSKGSVTNYLYSILNIFKMGVPMH